MTAFQNGLDCISKQIQSLQNELKSDFMTFKEEITGQMRHELSKFKEDIDQKFKNITTELKEQEGKLEAALTRTEEIETWSHEANQTLTELMREQKSMLTKLDDLELRSRCNNLRIYGIQEGAESKAESLAQFLEIWLREELNININLQIQRAHRALTPKPPAGLPPRSVVVNFQQFTTKEMILKKAWEKKIVTLDGSRVYFDHDYSARMVQERKAYVNIKKILKKEGIRFQTPLNKMRIHWPNGVKTYGNAEEAANDLQERGYNVEKGINSRERGSTEGRLSTGAATWKPVRPTYAGVASRRARERLQEFQRNDNNA